MARELTAKQEVACQKYRELRNKSAAYRSAYNTQNMKPATVNRKAKALFDQDKIKARVAELLAETVKKADLTVQGQIKKMGEITSLDPGELFDPDTKGLKPILDLPEHVRRAIASFEAVELPAKPGSNGKKRYKFKYKFWDKPKTVDMENKHIGFYEADNAQKAVEIKVLQQFIAIFDAATQAQLWTVCQERFGLSPAGVERDSGQAPT